MGIKTIPGIIVGIFQGTVNTLQNILDTFQHPISTAVGIGNAVSHPFDTGKAIFNSGSNTLDEFQDASDYEQGKMLGAGTVFIGSLLIPGGGEADIVDGASIAGRVVKVIPGIERSALPKNVEESLNYLENTSFQKDMLQPHEGSVFENREKLLPFGNGETYTRWTADLTNTSRRFVREDSSGKIYYTDTHYGRNPGEPFYRVESKK